MGLFSRFRSSHSRDSSVKSASKDHMRTDSFNGSVFSSATSDSSSTSAESMAYNKHNQLKPKRSAGLLSKSNANSAASSAWKSRPKSVFVGPTDKTAKPRLLSTINLDTASSHQSSSRSASPRRTRDSTLLTARKPPPVDNIEPLPPHQSLDPKARSRSRSPGRTLEFETPQKQIIAQTIDVSAANNIPRKSSPLAKVVYSPSPVVPPPVVSQKEGSLSPMSPGQPIGGGVNDSQLSLMLSPVSESVTSMNDPPLGNNNQFNFNQPAYVYHKPSTTTQDSYEADEERASSTSTVPPTQHPYYEQWKQYYEQLALHQQQYMNSNSSLQGNASPQDANFNPMMFMNPMNMPPYFYNPFMQMQPPPSPTASNNASFPQLPLNYSNSHLFDPYILQMQQQQQQQQHHHQQQKPSMPGRSSSAGNLVLEHDDNTEAQHDYLSQYKKTRNMKNELISEDNSLVSNSRKSTLKSNRYPSAPFQSRNVISESRGRVASVDTNFKPNEFHIYEEDEEDSKNTTEASIPSANTKSSPLKSVEDRRRDLSRHISDYNKFLFGNEEDEENDSEEEEAEPKKDMEKVTSVDHQLPTPTSEDGLSRNDSESSATSSCDSIQDSIQSNGSKKFIVGDLKSKKSATSVIPRETSVSPDSKNKKKVSPVSTQLFPLQNSSSRSDLNSGAPSPRPLSMMPSRSDLTGTVTPTPRPLSMMPQISRSMEPMYNSPYSNPVLTQNTEYSGSSVSLGHNRRQSIATTESKRRSMAFNPNMGGNKRNSVAVFGSYSPPHQQQQHQLHAPAKINDATISKKIEQFIKLRKKIASGQKSLEYRLYWVKMLIDATNFKLYAYINIKGDPVSPEQIPNNKLLFMKSSETHLNKLMKELEADVIEREGIKSEVYFIYGSLFKQDYLNLYNQDFGIEKDVESAIMYFEKVLEINPKDFRALYKLGEIYEFDLENEFDRGVQYYTEAAKLGYNRAIFKMSMLYLHIPQLRSVKYLKYLHNLANIELRDVRLDEEDLDEMEEIIGLASYELGRIYEGIYPGDLSMDDDFIKDSVELAPVNYAKSLTYYNKSARLNCLLAQVRLGIVYEKGELNRQQNPNKSIQWFIKASSSPLSFRRHPEAMVGLARWYLRGTDGSSKYVPIASPEKAVMWCDRAIKEFNSPDALFMMGELSERRYTNSNSQMWYKKAYELGSEAAGEKLGYV